MRLIQTVTGTQFTDVSGQVIETRLDEGMLVSLDIPLAEDGRAPRAVKLNGVWFIPCGGLPCEDRLNRQLQDPIQTKPKIESIDCA